MGAEGKPYKSIQRARQVIHAGPVVIGAERRAGGKHFLSESRGRKQRSALRFLPSLDGYFYVHQNLHQ
jgi:hypothetical protein